MHFLCVIRYTIFIFIFNPSLSLSPFFQLGSHILTDTHRLAGGSIKIDELYKYYADNVTKNYLIVRLSCLLTQPLLFFVCLPL